MMMAEAVLSRIQAVQMAWARFHLSTFAMLQASCHRGVHYSYEQPVWKCEYSLTGRLSTL